MTLFDQYGVVRRRVGDVPMPGLVRMDRALLYVQRRLRAVLEHVETKKTKTLGDAYYRVISAAREVTSICHMGGDRVLGEMVSAAISTLSQRTPRADAAAALKALLDRLSTYEPIDISGLDLMPDLPAIEPKSSVPARESVETQLGDERTVFVIMPFSADFGDVWKGGIQRAAEEEKFTTIRVDQINRSTNITDDIVAGIEKCRLAIVDVTGNNPNVMFELGYAIARGKKNIIISQSADYLPFDIRNIRTIVYSNTWSGIEDLKLRVQEFLREALPTKGTRKAGSKPSAA